MSCSLSLALMTFTTLCYRTWAASVAVFTQRRSLSTYFSVHTVITTPMSRHGWVIKKTHYFPTIIVVVFPLYYSEIDIMSSLFWDYEMRSLHLLVLVTRGPWMSWAFFTWTAGQFDYNIFLLRVVQNVVSLYLVSALNICN